MFFFYQIIISILLIFSPIIIVYRIFKKKEDIKRNILEGKMKKFINENTLLNQPFVKDPSTSLSKIIKSNEKELVEHIGMTVVETNAERSREDSLSESNEGGLLQSHVVSQGTDTASEDVLS